MTVYIKKKESLSIALQPNREITIAGWGTENFDDALKVLAGDTSGLKSATVHHIPVPDTLVLCNGCNENQFPNPVYMVYLTKNDLKADRPYDCYCMSCVKKYFPKAEVIE